MATCSSDSAITTKQIRAFDLILGQSLIFYRQKNIILCRVIITACPGSGAGHGHNVFHV